LIVHATSVKSTRIHGVLPVNSVCKERRK
jgi:hypothetical protein